MEQMPMISPSSDAQWKDYYAKKFTDSDKQLADLAWAMAHMIRLGMEGKKADIYMLGQRVVRRLEYPRDKQQIIDELAKWTQYQGSILRDDSTD